MDSPAASAATAPVCEDHAADRTADLLAEAAHRLSAHTSALHSVALRLLAAEGCLAELSAAAARARPPEERAWSGPLPAESSSKTLAAASKIRLLAMHGVEGNTGMEELALLVAFARLAAARAIFVFPTLDGRTTVNLAANCAPGGMVYTLNLRGAADASRPVDGGMPSENRAAGLCYTGTPFEPSVVQLHGSSEDFDFSRFYGAMDFVLVDGCGKYERVMNDTRLALRLLRAGRGLIAWRGYSKDRDGVVRALEEQHRSEPKLAGMRHIEGTALVYARVE